MRLKHQLRFHFRAKLCVTTSQYAGGTNLMPALTMSEKETFALQLST